MKKGFTILEVLGVVIILALLFAISVPMVSKVIYDSKVNLYKKNEQVLVKAADLFALKNQSYYPNEIGESKEIRLRTLQEHKYISSIVNPQDSEQECRGYVLITKIAPTEYDFTPHLKCGVNINTVEEDKLIGHWKFNGNTFDYTINNNHGVLVGNATYTEGKIEEALSFNIGRIETEIPDIPRDMTYSVWFKKTTSSWGSIAIIGNRRSSSGWMLYRNSGDPQGYFRWYQYYLTTADAIATYRAWPGYSNLQVGVWYNIVATRTKDGYSNLYLNGVLLSESTPPSNFKDWVYSAANISIGSGEGSGSSSWQSSGMILDDFRLYDRILSDQEILNIYDLGK